MFADGRGDGLTMRRKGERVARTTALAFGIVFAAVTLHAQTPGKRSDNYDELYEKYLAEARQSAAASAPAQQPWGWMSNLGQDFRARRVNDLLTINVIESITGTGSADAALDKQSSANFGFNPNLGFPTKSPTFDGSTNTDFKGGGTTTRAGMLQAQMTARVADVLPNGDLVIEGVREIEINGDRQIVVLTGVVRAVDVNPRNAVASTSIGQLRIRYFGRGLMKDNLQPGWLIRVLNKVF